MRGDAVMNATLPASRLGLVLTGTSGAGKSTLAEALCARDRRFSWVSAVTTRDPRPDDRPGAYSYITVREFENLKVNNLLLNHTEYRDRSYGISVEAALEPLDHGLIPLILASPESVVRFKRVSGDLRSDRRAATVDPCFFRVFLDAPDAVINQRLGLREGIEVDPGILVQRSRDRQFIEHCDRVVASLDLNVSLDALVAAYQSAAGPLTDA
jgi:ribose 1,5-bisphosphokinase PhnN